MNTLLHLDSSLYGRNGASSQLSAGYVDQWRQHHPSGTIIYRDLTASAVPHLDGERFAAFTTPEAQRSATQQQIVAQSDALIAELERANTVVIGVPMYNFSIPSTLKSWIDHVARAGRTFRYTANGPEGLLKDKQAVLFLTRGGKYQGTAADTQSAYLKQFLSFIGIDDVQLIYAEGLAYGSEIRAQSLAAAHHVAEQRLSQAMAA